jgi:methylated-DNA-[protein]-cysteine S-methyltransferase
MPELTITETSPVGPLSVEEQDGAIVAVRWRKARQESSTPLLEEAARQVRAYLARELRDFDLPLRPEGAAFEQQVWAAMQRIPYGETRSYGEIAKDTGGMPQEVGQACGSNPLPIIIPCHRVLAGGGKLGGYSGKGGLETKTALLVLEGRLLV